MNSWQDEQIIGQLEKRKGGYFYIVVSADTVNTFKNKRQTRFLCTLDKKLTFRCGLNHLGDGNFFIIISGKNLQTIGKTTGDSLFFELTEDPDPLGVPMPEVLEALLEQDEPLKALFEALSMGKKRHVIHTISRIRDLDKQVSQAMKIIHEHGQTRRKNNP
jgi:hypothetical protein